jgi:hypothetical protein
VPTDRGVATVACTAPRGAAGASFLRDCESVAATLELAGARPYALGPSAAYAGTLRGVMTSLERARRSGAADLGRADTPAAQAKAADALSEAYLRAARALAGAKVSPADAAANAALAQALRETSLAYSRAADAARANDGDAYAAAAQALKTEQARLRRALSGLERLGYVLS